MGDVAAIERQAGEAFDQPGWVYERIRDDIISARLQPNQRLKVGDLAAQYGTSTNPVREALQQLRGEGFVLIEPNRGARVRPIDEAFVRDIIEIEVLIEPSLTKWFVSIVDDADIDKLEAVQAEIEALNFADLARHGQLDTRFHQLIYDRHYNRHAAELWWKHREILRAISRRFPTSLSRRDALIGEDPTDVERVMLKIRQRGSFKPYGAAVSVIEHALWDIAGKAAGVPVYKLLGGKVRDKVRVYNGSIRRKRTGDQPEDYAADVKWMMERPENFFMVKQGISFHSNMKDTIDDFHYGVRPAKAGYHGMMDQGQISERGMAHMIDCVIAMKEVLGNKVSLALDCGPGWFLPDAIRFAQAVEKYNLMWLEDMLTGDYVPWVNPQAYRELTTSTSTPIHTGEQIYLRHNFKELIETQAVRVIGPDPADIGGIAELKWVAEHAYMHSIMIAPHGTANGLLGLGALINVCATLPANYIAFEYPSASDPWWEDIVTGLPKQIVKDSMVDLLEAPGLGLDIDAEGAKRYLSENDAGFFD